MPFHSWTPDVYQGAPTPVTGFMAACTKIAAFGALLRVRLCRRRRRRLGLAARHLGRRDLTMLVGSVAGDHPDRREADAGLLLDRARRLRPGRPVATLGASTQIRASPACCSTCWRTASSRSARSLSSRWSATRRARRPTCRSGPGWASSRRSWQGVHALPAGLRRHPADQRLHGKFAVFAPAFDARATGWLVVVGVVASAVAAFFYFRVIVLMFFSEPCRGRAHGRGAQRR